MIASPTARIEFSVVPELPRMFSVQFALALLVKKRTPWVTASKLIVPVAAVAATVVRSSGPTRMLPVRVLLVRVSVVALPTNVSVEVGRVKVPVFVIEEMTGVVSVLLVKVWLPVKVATVESMATVGIGPVALEMLIPVPAVRAVISPVAPTHADPS